MPEIESLSELVPVLGRAHPLILHLPIGLLVGLALLEIGNALGRKPAASTFLVFLAAASAAATAGSGLILHEEPSYAESRMLELHEQLGLATAACALVVFVLRSFGATVMYRWALLLTVGVLVPTGHYGAEMVHGKGFLLEPLEWEDEETEPVAPEPAPETEDGPTLASFEVHVMDFFERKCIECHGERKVKGGLRLDSAEALLAGGDGGPAIEAGIAAEEQELLYRMLLPLDDDDHMPPEQKAQPTEAELELVRAWLAAGAPFEGEFALAEGSELPVQEPEAAPPAADAEATPADAEPVASAPEVEPGVPASVLEHLREQLVHVQPVQAGSPLLWVDFAAPASSIDDDAVRELLTPLVDHVAELSLARTKISDASLELIAVMPALRRLDLRSTAITDVGLARLAEHPTLTELVVSRTQLTDASIGSFEQIPALRKLWIWDAGLSEAGLVALREALPSLQVDAGDMALATALETEETVEFTNEAADVDAPAEATGEDLSQRTPINDVCLVSGKAIDPQFNLLHEGQVIGFCCPNCPAAFQAEPAKYLAKLPPASAKDGNAEDLSARTPVNAVCLVSGKAIDPQFNLLHEGQVIGFCCPNCPAAFQADPAKYLAKLEPGSDG